MYMNVLCKFKIVYYSTEDGNKKLTTKYHQDVPSWYTGLKKSRTKIWCQGEMNFGIYLPEFDMHS
jgi:hypothetical protein